MKNRKSQITMLMILGLVLFIAISLVLYLSKSAVKKQSQQSIRKTQETAVRTQPIKEFVQKCMDKLAKDAVVLLGSQGGYIYKSQGGTLIDYKDSDEGLFFVKYKNNKVVYNILPPRFVPSPPIYPWEFFPYKAKDSDEQIFDWYFGISNMPPLTPSQGPNSIQSQIETFIDSNMPKCAELSFFEKQGLEVVINSTKTSVVIGRDDLSVQSKIPIRITNPATNELAEISDFSTNLDVRLKDLYYFAKELIDNDVRNIKFNISNIKNERDSFRVKVAKDVLQKDDLVIITDGKSLVYGNQYQYIFSRKNRIPALYYIKNNVLQFPRDYKIELQDLLSGTELKAEEPDEDDVIFNVVELTSTITPSLPNNNPLRIPQQKFKINVSDGALSDYQIITVNRTQT